MADEALDRPWRGVAQDADRVALALLADVPELVDLLDARVARTQSLHHAPHPAGAFAARRALAAALVLVEIGVARDDADQIGGLVNHDHRGGAERGVDGLQRVEIHDDVVADGFRVYR